MSIAPSAPAGSFSDYSESPAPALLDTLAEPHTAATLSSIDMPQVEDAARDPWEKTDPLLRPDSLSTGIVFVLAAMIVQRLVGMVRSVLFCDLMSEEEVGLFSLGFSSLVLLAPFAVLGIPGSFGRYVEYYRQRGELGAYLRRTICVSLGLGAALSLAIVVFANWAAVLLFNDASQFHLAMLTGVSLFFVVTFNLLNELATALRKTRRASWMQFVSSIAFAAAGLSLLWVSGGLAEYAVLGYAAACVAASLVAWPVVRAVWQISDTSDARLSNRTMWGKLLPYTAWFWAFNLLTNVFDISDRYLILWWSKAPIAEAQALVGQLHSARVFPVLIVGLATMIAGILLPHLSHDWETGRREQVAQKLRFAIKISSLIFSFLSAGVIFAAPVIFHIVWRGRYDQGLSLLPITCSMCVWQCLTILSQQYLWCTERARLACIPISVGLVLGLGLNAFLLPRYGIAGAAVSAALANFATLGTTMGLARYLGFKPKGSMATFLLWPGILVIGLWSGLFALTVATAGGVSLLWFLEPEEKRLLAAQWDAAKRRFGFGVPQTIYDKGGD